MRFKFSIISLGLLSIGTGLWAQAGDVQSASLPAGQAGALQSSNILNPNISVVGWFQGEAGHPHPGPGLTTDPPLALHETEIGLQAIVDPYAKGDFFVSFDQDGVANLEEGYITWFHLPYGLSLRTGKFRSLWGVFNKTHPHDTPFATRPLAEQNYFGDGLSGEGGGLSWQIPIPWVYLNLDAEAMRPPAGSDVPAFDRAQRSDLLYTSRLSTYYDLTDAANVLAGVSYANGPAGQQFAGVSNSSQTLKDQLYGWDLTFRWKNPRRAIYNSFIWQTEMFWSKRDMPFTATALTRGWFSYIQYQFAQRWVAGFRYDYSDWPIDATKHETGKLVYVTFSPSEFSHLSLQGSHVKRADGGPEDLGFLRVIFNIGPHGAHPF